MHSAPEMVHWDQTAFNLSSQSSGSYLITNDVYANVVAISQYRLGLLHLFVQHASCGLFLSDVSTGVVSTDSKRTPESMSQDRDDDTGADTSVSTMQARIGFH